MRFLVLLIFSMIPAMAQLRVNEGSGDPGPQPAQDDWFYFPNGLLDETGRQAVMEGFVAARDYLGVTATADRFVFVAHPIHVYNETGFSCGYIDPSYTYCGGYFESRPSQWVFGLPEIHVVADDNDPNRVYELAFDESLHALCWWAGGAKWREIGHSTQSCW